VRPMRFRARGTPLFAAARGAAGRARVGGWRGRAEPRRVGAQEYRKERARTAAAAGGAPGRWVFARAAALLAPLRAVLWDRGAARLLGACLPGAAGDDAMELLESEVCAPLPSQRASPPLSY
jgi:hypothetical protein